MSRQRLRIERFRSPATNWEALLGYLGPWYEIGYWEDGRIGWRIGNYTLFDLLRHLDELGSDLEL